MLEVAIEVGAIGSVIGIIGASIVHIGSTPMGKGCEEVSQPSRGSVLHTRAIESRHQTGSKHSDGR